MTTSDQLPDKVPPVHDAPTPIRALPSGRQVVVCADSDGEAIEVRSADGQMEVRIALTDQGPVLSLRGAKLQIESTDTVAVNCKQFEVNTTEGVTLCSQGEVGIQCDADMRLKSGGDTYIDGDYVNVNCLERTGYHDEGVEYEQEEVPQLEDLSTPATDPPTRDAES